MTTRQKPHIVRRGFTLIELMVSVTIFIVVMTISLGALLTMSAADRRAEAIKSVMNNLSFAMESMTRTIRTGYDYGCNSTVPSDCNSSGAPRITLTAVNADADASSDTVSYCIGSLSGSAYSCSGTTNCTATSGCSILRSVDGGAFQPMTAPEVRVENLNFYVLGSVPGNTVQPRVLITIDGKVELNEPADVTFQLQTMVTQRRYDQ